MLKISAKTSVRYMTSDNEPALSCKPGDTVVFETVDCFGGQIACEADVNKELDDGRMNLATGPLFVEGAEAGDVLKVEIKRITIADHGVIYEGAGEGVTGKALTDEAAKIIPIAGDEFVLNDLLKFKIDPMIGVIGTAPKEGDSISTSTPDYHGGNMDCNRIREGATLYLPVNVPGALLALGDLHARMGNGEVCVCGIEIPGEVTVKVTVLKDCRYKTPFLIDGKEMMTIYSAETLDEAADGATLLMREFLIDEVGVAPHDAGFLLSAVGNLEICQCVDPKRTCRMEVPLEVAEKYGYNFR
ncbi:MAG: acetamidase/formamidase family protein [Lachnospiraceae bacterium]|nr:acetamidase/formamidase family protein [Lachnospiraceae bacterium]